MIDFSPLASTRFGFQQLGQLSRLALTPDQVQESIHAFAFDFEANGKSREINGAALNYFMGILRKGPYAPPANYESPELRQMRVYLEAKMRNQQARAEMEAKIEAVEFDWWMTGLTTEEKTRYVPVTDFAKPGSMGHNVLLKQYFRENIWPKRRENIYPGG